ncbi:MAG: DNA mismatch repair endonuclease MutL [Bacteroidales bacterium]|nr:DNA mismatch repair endonuclease MutL [Bacteroidales bacterium]
MISVLPSHIASQIAAGEVIQRPASVIKELMENAVDSGADRIDVVLTDGGATLMQVSDNGCGMSPEDALLAFERHATSKIRGVEDLEQVATFGFRGEALPSIASVAHIRLRTRREEDELGTEITLSGSEITSQEEVACTKGSDFCVRNLFYNVPARRRFLKSEQVEMRHILEEFYRVALCHPNVTFTLNHNSSTLHHLPAGDTLRSRISGALGKDLNTQLLDIHVETSLVTINGYVSRPKDSHKRGGHRYFFINGRYFRSPYLHKAVMNAYEKLLPEDKLPTYFIYLETDPQIIDVNIHPTKTEIKFEDENVIFQMLQAVIRETLGKFAMGPTIDFDLGGMQHHIPIPPAPGEYVPPPRIDYDPLFDPFQQTQETPPLFKEEPVQTFQTPVMPLHKKYLLTLVPTGVMVIHKQRALERIFYEELLPRFEEKQPVAEPLVLPVALNLQPPLSLHFEESRGLLLQMGFQTDEEGNVTSVPPEHPTDEESVRESISELLSAPPGYATGAPGTAEAIGPTGTFGQKLAATVARSMAASEVRKNRDLGSISLNSSSTSGSNSSTSGSSIHSMSTNRLLVDRLLSCKEPARTADGRPILWILTTEQIDKYFT